jgi:transcriptional regulator with XRE-family HTH domain
MSTSKTVNMKSAMQPILCDWFKRYRAKRKISQEQMAMKFMMSVRSYSDLEHGISFPSGVTFARFLLMLTKEEQKEMLEDIRIEIERVR